ncbi:Uncharacterised protein [Segatella copri]|nr:Uncharacterised protein [Segatella copri]
MAEPWVSRSVTSSIDVSATNEAIETPVPPIPKVDVGSANICRSETMPSSIMSVMKRRYLTYELTIYIIRTNGHQEH